MMTYKAGYKISFHPASCIICLAAIFLFLPGTSGAEVVILDSIAIKDKPLMLEAETKGKLFRAGGEVVEFLVDGKSIGKTLSGGDGVAFKEFIPTKRGLHKLSAVSGSDKDSGFLLSLEKGERIVFIDVGECMTSQFSGEPVKDSQKVINAISKRFPVIYLQTDMFGVDATKKWLRENKFAGAPVLAWEDGSVFDGISKKGLRIKLVIGGAAVIESAKEFRPKAFSFDEVEGAIEVKDWNEIGKKLGLVIK